MKEETIPTMDDVLDRNGFDFEAFAFENEYSAKAIKSAMTEWEQISKAPLLAKIEELTQKNKFLNEQIQLFQNNLRSKPIQ